MADAHDGMVKRYRYLLAWWYELPTSETDPERVFFQPLRRRRFERVLEADGWAIKRGLRWAFSNERPSRS